MAKPAITNSDLVTSREIRIWELTELMIHSYHSGKDRFTTMKNTRSATRIARKKEILDVVLKEITAYAFFRRLSNSSAHFVVYRPISAAIALQLLHSAKTAQITITIKSIAGNAGLMFPRYCANSR